MQRKHYIIVFRDFQFNYVLKAFLALDRMKCAAPLFLAEIWKLSGSLSSSCELLTIVNYTPFTHTD